MVTIQSLPLPAVWGSCCWRRVSLRFVFLTAGGTSACRRGRQRVGQDDQPYHGGMAFGTEGRGGPKTPITQPSATHRRWHAASRAAPLPPPQCFSGCRPWHELSDAFQVVFKVCVEHARPPIPDDTPRQLRRLLERMMHANPLYRPSAPGAGAWLDRRRREACATACGTGRTRRQKAAEASVLPSTLLVTC